MKKFKKIAGYCDALTSIAKFLFWAVRLWRIAVTLGAITLAPSLHPADYACSICPAVRAASKTPGCTVPVSIRSKRQAA